MDKTMSFSSQQKEIIISGIYKSSCCRRTLLFGVLFAKANIENSKIVLTLEKPEYADFVAKLVREFYSKDVDIYRSEKGGRCIKLSFKSNSAEKYISDISGNSQILIQKCGNCLSSFLRGVFLAAGRVSNPEKQYSLDFSLGVRSEIFRDFLNGYGIPARISYKKSGTVLYVKSSSDIEDFYAYAGMNPAMFAIIEAKFEGEARKNIMRVTNCMTNNIQRAVDAAARQNQVISELEAANLLSSLPEELEQTARLRLKYPDLSLAQLAAIAVPSISKPGLSHRLKKIMELGTQLLHKDI